MFRSCVAPALLAVIFVLSFSSVRTFGSRLSLNLPQTPVTSPNSRDPRQLFQEGQAALSRGDLDSAEASFRSVLSLDPRSAAAYANLGVVEMRRKNWDAAVLDLRKAEHLAPHLSGIRLNIGIAEYRRANYPAAIAPLASVLRDEPDSVQARYLLGFCYSFVERYSDSVAILEPLWPKMNNDFIYLYVLGISAFKSGNTGLDQKALSRLVEIGSDKPEFHFLIGRAFLNRDENSKALQEFQKVAAVNPNLPLLHFNLGVVYQRMGKTDLAEAEFNKDITIEPDMPYNYEQLGKLYVQAGRDDQAEREFQTAIRHDPRLPASLLELAKIDQRRGKYQEALDKLHAAEKLAPDSQSLHFVRGQILLRLGREAEAKKELATAQKLLDTGLTKDRAKLNDNPVPNPEVSQQP